jgi:hypothetical protein
MLGIVKENLCGVCDAVILLSLSASTVDAGCSFSGISTHKAEGNVGRLEKRKGKKRERERDGPLLVEEENIGTTLEKSVSCREAGKTTTDYDDLCHVGLIE